jgi:hypothetical protein
LKGLDEVDNSYKYKRNIVTLAFGFYKIKRNETKMKKIKKMGKEGGKDRIGLSSPEKWNKDEEEKEDGEGGWKNRVACFFAFPSYLLHLLHLCYLF